MTTRRERVAAFPNMLKRNWNNWKFGKFVLATFAASGVGYLGSSAAPVTVQALLDGTSFNEQDVGILGTVELSTLALTSFAMVPVVPRVSHRLLAVAGAIVAALGFALSAVSEAFLPFAIARIIIGIGSGAAIAGANAAIAARADAERIYAIIWTGGGGVTALLSGLLPLAVRGGRYDLGFGVLAGLAVLALLVLRWVPPRPSEQTTAAPVARGGGYGAAAVLVLAAVLVYSIAEQGLWQFSYSIPEQAGIGYDAIRIALMVSTLAGLVGGLIAAVLGTRLGRLLPIVAGSLLSLFGRWGYINATGAYELGAMSLVWGLGFYFVSPYQMGLAAALDRSGRVAVATGGITNVGYALGPVIAGSMIVQLGNSALVVAVVAATLLSLVLLLPVAIGQDRAARAALGREPAAALEEPSAVE
jgi:predicted MFS family arabinose efflux permease